MRPPEALADDLRRFLDGQPILARPIGLWGRGVKWARRRPAVAGLGALAVVLAVAGVAGISWKWREATEQRNEAILARTEEAQRAGSEAAAKVKAQEAEQEAKNRTAAEIEANRKLQRTIYFQNINLANHEWFVNNNGARAPGHCSMPASRRSCAPGSGAISITWSGARPS